jgi:hypothetical protein
MLGLLQAGKPACVIEVLPQAPDGAGSRPAEGPPADAKLANRHRY